MSSIDEPSPWGSLDICLNLQSSLPVNSLSFLHELTQDTNRVCNVGVSDGEI